MTSEEMIIEIKKRKFLFLIATVLVFFLSYFVQSRVMQSYSATTSFIVNETEMSYLNGPGQVMSSNIDNNASSVNRIFQFAYSNELTNHLIQKFRLYDYYKISPNEPFAYAKVVARLSNRIRLSKTDQNIIKVSVSDKDRYQAASIANEVTLKLNSINEKYIKTQLRNKITIYQALYTDIKKDLEAHEEKMNQILENYKAVINSLEKNKAEVESLKYSLIDLTSNLKNKREEMIRMKGLYAVMLQTLEKEHFNTITNINTALPDYRSNLVANIVFSIVIALFSLSVMIILLNFYITYYRYIVLIFKK